MHVHYNFCENVIMKYILVLWCCVVLALVGLELQFLTIHLKSIQLGQKTGLKSQVLRNLCKGLDSSQYVEEIDFYYAG